MSSSSSDLAQIDHVVVLMLENRSFDHMLGFLYAGEGNVSPLGHPFEGLTGNETNLKSDGTPVRVFRIRPESLNGSPYFMPGADPGEGFYNTNLQVYGTHSPGPGAQPTMSGFVTNYEATLDEDPAQHRCVVQGTVAEDIMGMYPPEMLPVLSALARGYAVCDHWYGSAPTETLPNRAFFSMGTSQGRLTDKVRTYTARSIFPALEQAGATWAVYGYNAPPLTRTSVVDIKYASNDHFGEYGDFEAAVQSGKLANFVFLEPSWGRTGNSQHPNYDVAKGEQLLAQVYRTLHGSPVWDRTLFIITYDEHGGCYDHVPPPTNATPPDDSAGQFGFDFTRFGPRVPTVLVSPMIRAGTVHRSPTDVPFDHTSILATLEKRFGVAPLTARDTAAADVGGALTLRTPRTDDVLDGITAPDSGGSPPCEDEPAHLQEVHADTVSDLPLSGEYGHPYPDEVPHFATGREADEYVRRRYHGYYDRRG